MEITSTTLSVGEFEWLVTSGIKDSRNYRVKIIDTANSSTYDYSDYFQIKSSRIIPGYNNMIILGVSSIGILFMALKAKQFKEKQNKEY